VVDDDIVDFFRVYDFADVGDQIFRESVFDCVDESHFFVYNEVGVVCASSTCNIPVEITYVPVYGSYPVDVVCQVYFYQLFSPVTP